MGMTITTDPAIRRAIVYGMQDGRIDAGLLLHFSIDSRIVLGKRVFWLKDRGARCDV